MYWLIVAVFILILGMIFYLKMNNKMYLWWGIVRVLKKIAITQDIKYIQETNNRVTGSGKKINLLEKGKVKKNFAISKEHYEQYVQFCESKHLILTIEEQIICETIIETEDILDPQKALDRELERTHKEYHVVYEIVNESGEKLLLCRREASDTISKVENLVNSIAMSPKSYDKEIKEIVVIRENFIDALSFGQKQAKALKDSAIGVGTGVAAGAAVATLAPGAAMWVATTFGTASTGVAISALSGAAATNAALAWLGGGALAVGGSGMAAGQALLLLAGPVGWGIAGGSILTSILVFWKKRMKIQENKKDEITTIKNCIASLKKLKADMDSVMIETVTINKLLYDSMKSCEYLKNRDYTTFTEDEKMMMASLVNNTKSLANLLGRVFVMEDNNDKTKTRRKSNKK